MYLFACSDRLVKFVFFVKNGNVLIDGTLEEPLDREALVQSFTESYLSQYTIRSTAQLALGRNLRKSLRLFVVGAVSQTKLADFTAALTADWTAVRKINGRRLKLTFEYQSKQEYSKGKNNDMYACRVGTKPLLTLIYEMS